MIKGQDSVLSCSFGKSD